MRLSLISNILRPDVKWLEVILILAADPIDVDFCLETIEF